LVRESAFIGEKLGRAFTLLQKKNHLDARGLILVKKGACKGSQFRDVPALGRDEAGETVPDFLHHFRNQSPGEQTLAVAGLMSAEVLDLNEQ